MKTSRDITEHRVMNDEQFAADSEYDEEPRSILSALWFRAVLAIAALGVVSAVAMPYVLEQTRPVPPPLPTAAASVRSSAVATPPMVPSPVEMATPAAPASPVPAVSSLPTSVASTPAPTVNAPLSATSAASPTSTTGRSVTPSVTATATTTTTPSATATPVTTAAGEGSVARISSTVGRPSASTRRPGAPGVSEPTAGTYWIQVGAYKDAEIAKHVASRLRADGYRVEAFVPAATDASAPASAPTAVSSDKYEVVVSGAPAAALTERLSAGGLSAETSKTGVVVKPPLPLAEAITLSKDLAGSGLKVQVRRVVATTSATPVTAAPGSVVGADGLHRVRVGAFTDRDAAIATLRELSEKGYPGFIARSTP